MINKTNAAYNFVLLQNYSFIQVPLSLTKHLTCKSMQKAMNKTKKVITNRPISESQ